MINYELSKSLKYYEIVVFIIQPFIPTVMIIIMVVITEKRKENYVTPCYHLPDVYARPAREVLPSLKRILQIMSGFCLVRSLQVIFLITEYLIFFYQLNISKKNGDFFSLVLQSHQAFQQDILQIIVYCFWSLKVDSAIGQIISSNVLGKCEENMYLVARDFSDSMIGHLTLYVLGP